MGVGRLLGLAVTGALTANIIKKAKPLESTKRLTNSLLNNTDRNQKKLWRKECQTFKM